MSLLGATGLRFAYGERPVLDGVALAVDAGEVVALVGPNGAGKTTLLHVALGLLRPSAGEARLGDAPVATLSRREVARRAALVPQETAVTAAFTVREVVAMGRTPHLGRFEPERREDAEAVAAALSAAGLTALSDRSVQELSGGERRLIHLARALAQEAPLLVCDEPTASLDLEHQLRALGLIADLCRAGRGALIALHDLGLAARFAARLLVLSGGRIVASGPPEDVLTEALLRDHFRVHARIVRDDGRLVVVPLGPAE